VKFQAERVRNAYMLQNSEVTVGGLQLSSASRSKIVEQSENTMILGLDVQFYHEDRLGLNGTGTQQVQIITLVLERILINLTWIKEIVG